MENLYFIREGWDKAMAGARKMGGSLSYIVTLGTLMWLTAIVPIIPGY